MCDYAITSEVKDAINHLCFYKLLSVVLIRSKNRKTFAMKSYQKLVNMQT